jgi:hypothetical protein
MAGDALEEPLAAVAVTEQMLSIGPIAAGRVGVIEVGDELWHRGQAQLL